ncbi:MAG: hypothetical protein U1D29_06950 [Burkholderiales bacterium]|nr:hypothetical protein [Burkholderiales bacterium]
MNSSDLEYAGFWVRVWASLIDTVLLGDLRPAGCGASLLGNGPAQRSLPI